MGKTNNTLCWDCDNCYGQCSWSAIFKPVNGWIAEKTIVDNQTSYNVIYCPEFTQGRERQKTYKELAKEMGVSLRTYYRKLETMGGKESEK